MTPFDPAALLAMLLAFYPIVGPAALARAHTERPEYFASGELIGRGGDKLQLPDGRIFDLIFNSPVGPWQCIEVPLAGGPAPPPDPFALEPGPIVPLDRSAFVTLLPREDFVGLVAERLADAPAFDAQLARAQRVVIEHSTPTRIESAYARLIEPAHAAHGAQLAAFDVVDPSDVVEASTTHGGAIDAAASDYDDPPPAEFHPIDPGPVPVTGPTQPPERD